MPGNSFGANVTTLRRASLRSPFQSGLLFGLGFSIPFIVLFWLGVGVLSLVMRNAEEPPPKMPARATFGPNSGLSIVTHGDHAGSSSLYVVGELVNKGKETWESVRLQVRLFDAHDQLVGLCEDILLNPLRPGAQVAFQVDCDKWDNDAFPKYKRYTVAIVDARPEFRIGA
jgi:hypothetical protein